MNVVVTTNPRPRDPAIVVVDPRARQIRRGFLRSGRMPRLRFSMAQLVLSGCGKVVPTADMIECLWGHDPDGGPLAPGKSITTHMHYVRDDLRPLGILIWNSFGWGYCAGLRP